jgi:hypothetical protein
MLSFQQFNEAAYVGKLHKSVNEKQEFVSKAGAGEWGRPEPVEKYKKETPGQNIKKFKDYIK